MLVLFFTIIFIAELIIAGWLVSCIVSVDKKVCALNQEVLTIKPQIKDHISKLRATINKVLGGLNCFVDYVAKKSSDCKESFKKGLITKIVLFILKIPARRIVTIIEMAMSLKKFLKK